MAASVTDILPLADLKAEFGLPATHVSQDDYFRRLLMRAVDKVEFDVGKKLLDSFHTAFSDVPADDESPLVVTNRNFYFDAGNTSHEIDYWTNKGAGVTELPDGSIARGDIGRTVRSEDGSAYYMYTDMSWPTDVAENTRIRIKGSIETDPVPEGLKSAIIVLVRSLHKGDMQPPKNYKWLLQPYRRIVPQ